MCGVDKIATKSSDSFLHDTTQHISLSVEAINIDRPDIWGFKALTIKCPAQRSGNTSSPNS